MTPERRHRFAALVLLATAALASAAPFGAAPDALLPPEQAFVPQASADTLERVKVHFDIAEGVYLYRHAFRFTSLTQGVTLGEAQIPTGHRKTDDYFGEVETYRGAVDIVLPVAGAAPGGELELELRYQGCADIGVCYPPQTTRLLVPLPAAGTAAGTGTAAVSAAAPSAPLSEQDRFAARLARGLSLLTLAAFFGAGLLLAFTPCVFPMVPILAGLVVGRREALGTRRAFGLSLAYVLAMAATYSIAGVIVGLSGQNVQAWFQNPWVIGAFAAVFVLLALSMFGVFTLQMPAAVQTRLNALANRQRGGTLVGAAVMGVLSALIVGPCVTAPLIGALIYIAQTGDAVLGGAALFALSLGMGLPLLAVGTSAGAWLPKAGPWMDAVKAFFGILLLAVAIWLLDRVVPPAVTMALAALLALGTAVWLGALEPLPADTGPARRLGKFCGLALLLYGALLLTGAAIGGGDLLQPLKGLRGAAGAVQAESGPTFRPIKGQDGLAEALAAAGGRPVVLDLYADWCVSCKELEAFTFTDPTVGDRLARFERLRADVTANDAQDRALLAELGVFGPPALLFYAGDGRELRGHRVVGFVPAEDFAAHLDRVLAASCAADTAAC
ncbi:MAG: thiol:disulfide interchange protein DsbD [Gammaproteobacteria bacterium]|nr:MAG: thiol:disulfide interchange protein DsbD [Gammaproteobacteria bacterium]